MVFQHAPQGLSFQDEDKNTLLHIVTAHLDIGKIYSIVEHLLKTDYPKTQKPFDQPNKNHESPLFLAVMRRSPEVVAYLLEIGANPNNQTLNGDRDFCLHYAAARGMNKITEVFWLILLTNNNIQLLCAEPATNLNAVNGRGQTPLLTAIRNHGAIDEATQGVIDNQQVIITLLKAGADAQITVSLQLPCSRSPFPPQARPKTTGRVRVSHRLSLRPPLAIAHTLAEDTRGVLS